MTFPWQAVLFDLDGTLVDSHDYWFATLNRTARILGAPPVERHAFDATFGQSVEADRDEFFPRATVERVDALFSEAVDELAHMVRVMPGARDVLLHVRDRGARVAVVTNSTSRFTHAVLRAGELQALVDATACADHVQHPKPAPDLVHHALAALGMQASHAVMVGDSRYDVAAARAAGVRCVGLRVDADVTVKTLVEVPQVLASLGA